MRCFTEIPTTEIDNLESGLYPKYSTEWKKRAQCILKTLAAEATEHGFEMFVDIWGTVEIYLQANVRSNSLDKSYKVAELNLRFDSENKLGVTRLMLAKIDTDMKLQVGVDMHAFNQSALDRHGFTTDKWARGRNKHNRRIKVTDDMVVPFKMTWLQNWLRKAKQNMSDVRHKLALIEKENRKLDVENETYEAALNEYAADLEAISPDLMMEVTSDKGEYPQWNINIYNYTDKNGYKRFIPKGKMLEENVRQSYFIKNDEIEGILNAPTTPLFSITKSFSRYGGSESCLYTIMKCNDKFHINYGKKAYIINEIHNDKLEEKFNKSYETFEDAAATIFDVIKLDNKMFNCYKKFFVESNMLFDEL